MLDRGLSFAWPVFEPTARECLITAASEDKREAFTSLSYRPTNPG